MSEATTMQAQAPLPGRAAVRAATTALRAGMQRIALWRRRARTRRALAGLNARLLDDIGLAPAQARREAAKWFWQA